LPEPEAGVTPLSAIILRAAGPGSFAGAAAGAGAGAGFAAATAAAGLAAAFAGAAPGAIVPSSAPTFTVVPAGALISAMVPADGAGTSTVTLSVSSSTSGSSAATASPACLNHLATVASVTDSPSVGTLISTAMSFVLSDVARRQAFRASSTSLACSWLWRL
jgi:hypothetical protein